MSNLMLRVFAISLLAGLPAAEVLAAAALPAFRVSSITADDAGGIYNGSNVNVTVTIRNAGSGSGSWQAALDIPDGYAFIDPNPCGGVVTTLPRCRAKALPQPGSAYYLLWPNGTDGMGSGNTLAPGATSTCTVRLTVTTATANDAATASVFNAPHSSCGTNSTDSQSYTFATTSGPTTDMSIALSASKSTVSINDTVDYTLTATNRGRQDGQNVNAVFNFPTTLQVGPLNCPGANTTGGQAIGWATGTVPYGTSKTCVLRATARASSGTATVTSTITTSMTDPNATNNSASNTVTFAAAAAADVSAAISANKTQVALGDVVTYTLTASNAGPQDAPATQLTATFPAQLKLNSASCVTGTISSPFVWTVGTLLATKTQTCTVQATVNSASVDTIVSSVSATSGVNDPNTGNNSSTASISLQQTQPVANLAIHLSGATAGHTYAPGEQLHLTVSANNTTTTATASGVVATLHVPNNGDLGNLTASCGTFDAAGNLTWNIGTLIGGTSITCSVSATVGGGSRTIPVSVRLDASTFGNDLSQLMDSLLIAVNPLPRQISQTTSGAPTTHDSTRVALSGDGSVAVFQSQETQLVANNVNTSGQDIYRVGSDGKAVLETMDSSGHQLIGTASQPAVSSDGGLVAFAFSNSAVAAKGKATVTSSMWAGSAGQPKHQVDMGSAGAAPNGATSGAPSISTADGSKKLAFCSAASNLVAGDSNGANDIFIVDPTNPALPAQRVSTDDHGVQLAGDSCEPKLSADGNKVVFTISAPGLYGTSARQVVRKDLVSGKLELISGNAAAGTFANADSAEPTISADGSVVGFTSQASNLDSLGAPIGGREVFVSLGQSGADGSPRILKRVRSADGIVPNGASEHAQVSNDGSVLVMQTLATNFFGTGKALETPACGAVAMTMNFFTPAALGSTLCGGTTTNQNPTISGDGSVASFDSNAPQPTTASNNSNTYVQSISGLNSLGTSNFGDDFSGQWFDSNQSGQGLVIDVLPPQADNTRIMSVIWFVYLNGQPTWLLGAAVPHAGTGADAGKVIVQMTQVGIYQGRAFPLGEPAASASLWGSMTLTFADASTGTSSWTSSYPGFNSGTMSISHFLPVGLPANDLASAQVKSCYSGNWKEPTNSGHGFEFEVIPASPPVLAVDWFAFSPSGAPVWLQGAGTISGNGAQMTLALIDGSGAQFPPKFNAKQITQHAWGTATFTFTDATHAKMSWNSTIPGYGAGSIDLVPTFGLERRSCQ